MFELASNPNKWESAHVGEVKVRSDKRAALTDCQRKYLVVRRAAVTGILYVHRVAPGRAQRRRQLAGQILIDKKTSQLLADRAHTLM